MAKVITQNDLIDVINTNSKTIDLVFNTIQSVVIHCKKLPPSIIEQTNKSLKHIIGLVDKIKDVIECIIDKFGPKLSDPIIITFITNKAALISKSFTLLFNLFEVVKAHLTLIEDLYNRIKKIHFITYIILKVQMIKLFIHDLINMVTGVMLHLAFSSITWVFATKLAMITVIVKLLSAAVNAFVGAKLGFITGWGWEDKMKRIIKFTRYLNIIIWRLKNIRKKQATEAVIGITLAKYIMVNLATMMTVLVLITPIILLFIITSPVILLGIWIFAQLLKVLIQIVAKLASVKTLLGLLMIAILIGSLLFVVVMVSVLGLLLAKMDLLSLIGDIVLFLLGLIAIGLLLVLFSMLIGNVYAAVAIGMGILACVSLGILIGAVLLIGVMLLLIPKIKLDKEAIKETIHDIIECVMTILDALFNKLSGQSPDDKEGKPWYKKLLGFLGDKIKIVGMIGMTIMSIYPLFLSFIAIGIIFIIGLVLNQIQKIKLNKKEIKDNVATVLECVLYIIDTIWNSIINPNPSSSKNENKSWFKTLLNFMGGMIKNLITPILAVRLLALSIISIGLIQILVRQLKDVEEVELDTKLIKKNIEDIMGAAISVIDVFTNATTGSREKGDKPWYKIVLEWIGGTVKHLISSILAIRFLALSLVSIGLIQLLARQLKDIEEVELDTNLIKLNIHQIIDCAMSVIDAFTNAMTGSQEEGDKPWYQTILDWMGGTIKQLIVPILAIRFLALSIVSIGLIKLLSGQLQDIEKVQLDVNNIKKTIQDAVSAAFSVQSAIFHAKNEQPKKQPNGWFEDLIDAIVPDEVQTAVTAMTSIGSLAAAFVSMWLLRHLVDTLNKVCTFNYSKTEVENRTNAIINTSNYIATSVFNAKTTGTQWARAESVLNRSTRAVEKLVKLGELYKQINPINELRFKAAKDIASTTVAIAPIIDKIVNKVKSPHQKVLLRLNELELLIKILKDTSGLNSEHIKNSEAITKNYIQLLDKVDKVNLDKLKTTTKLFEKMAQFSESINGNFEGLADALNEKIAPLLEKLESGVAGLKTSVVQSGADVSSSVFAASRDTLNANEMAAQVKREMPNATNEERAQATMMQMQAQAKQQSNNLMSKLDELIELFRNGDARVVMS